MQFPSKLWWFIATFVSLVSCQVEKIDIYIHEGYEAQMENGVIYVYSKGYKDGKDAVDIFTINQLEGTMTVWTVMNELDHIDDALTLDEIIDYLWAWFVPNGHMRYITFFRYYNEKTRRWADRIWELANRPASRMVSTMCNDEGRMAHAWDTFFQIPSVYWAVNYGKRVQRLPVAATLITTTDHTGKMFDTIGLLMQREEDAYEVCPLLLKV